MAKLAKKTVSIVAAKARYRRAMEKEGYVAKFHNPHHRDFLMNGRLFVMDVNPNTNGVVGHLDYNGFVEFMHESGLLKPNEVLEG